MMIGIPRERQDGENRVAIIPSGVSTLLEAGYEVVVESGAGSAAHSPMTTIATPGPSSPTMPTLCIVRPQSSSRFGRPHQRKRD